MNWKDFYNDRWKKKAFKTIERFSFFHKADNLSLFKDIQRWELVRKGDVILDAGCGWSIHGDLIADYLGAKTIKLDLSFSALKYMPKDIYYSPKCDLANSDLEDLPFASGSFSFILCSQVIEHIPNPEKTLQEYFRVLKPGGVMLIAIPNCYRDMNPILHELERQFDLSGHIHEFCKEKMRFLLEANKFSIQKIRYHCHYTFAFWAWLERTKAGENLSGFILKHNVISRLLEKITTYMLFFENLLFEKLANSALSIEFVVKKHE